MSDFKEYVSNPGNRLRPVYQPEVGEDGIITLKQIDTIDWYDKIQADAPYCDIDYLLQRYAAGDTSVMNRAQTFFADVTKAPTSLAEAYALNVKCENAFAQLPLEIREKFGHNYYKFLESAGTKEWIEMFKPAENPDVKESSEE